MKRTYFLNFILSLSLIGCASWKDKLKTSGNYEVAVENAIIDYLNTARHNKEFNTFHIINKLNDKVIGVSINGDANKWQMGEIKVGEKRKYFPSRFKEVEGKLFYWSDSTVSVTHNMIDIMKQYKILDTIKHSNNEIPDEVGPYSKGAVHYYFCKTNFLKYKKVKSTISIGYYEPPKLNCKN